MKNIEWGKYKLEDLFEIEGTKSLDSNAIDFIEEGINFVGRTSENNGVQGKIQKREFEPNAPYTITATVIGNYKYVKYQKEPYYCSQNINKLTPKKIISKWNERIAYFFVVNIQKFVSLYDNQQGGYKLNDIKNHYIELPLKNGKIDFEFMEKYIEELERICADELEKEQVREKKAYLKASGIKNYNLTFEEEQIIENLRFLEWKSYNLENLFGKATRGKRLKSADRIPGKLPFVTAGETNEGISDFIGNDVKIFPKNTITIDMFGSAKYRNYEYGGDDHIAVVHTEGLSMEAAIFVTTAIHKSSHTGQFDYGRNFYAKDADNLDILLPTKGEKPDFEVMKKIVSVVHKMVIKDLYLYADKKSEAIKQIIMF